MPDNSNDILSLAGFSNSEIQSNSESQINDLAVAGFDTNEIKQYAGINEPDTKRLQDYWNGVSTFVKGNSQEDYGNDPKKFFQHYYERGLGKSLVPIVNAYNKGTGLPEAFNQPQDGGVLGKIAEGLGTITGDLTGFIPTAYAVSKATPGGLRGKAITTFAVGAITPMVKEMYIDALKENRTNSFLDWYKSFIDVGVKTGIEEGTKLTASILLPAAYGVTGITTTALSQAAIYEGIGSIYNRHLPSAEDAVASVALFGLFGMSERAVNKSLQIIKKENITIPEIVDAASKNPVIKQELVSLNKDKPTAFLTEAEKKDIEQIGKSEPNPIIEIESLKSEIEKIKSEPDKKIPEDIKATIKNLEDSIPSYANTLNYERQGSTRYNELKSQLDNSTKQLNELKSKYQDDKQSRIIELEKKLSEKNKNILNSEQSLDPDIAKVRSKIKSTPIFDNPTLKEYANVFYTHVFDKLHPVFLAVKKVNENGIAYTKGGKLDPYENMRSQPGIISIALNFILKSPIKFKDSKNIGESFDAIIKPIKNDAKARLELDDYLASKASIERTSQGFETGIDQVAAKNVVKKLEAKYEVYAIKLKEYQNHVLNYLVDSGLLTPEVAKAFNELNKNYVPLHRIMEDKTNASSYIKQSGSSLKRFKGDKSDIISPLESIVKNTMALIPLAERNKAFIEFIEMVEANKKLFPEINKSTKTNVIEIQKEELSKFVDNPEMLTQDSIKIFRKNSQIVSDTEIAIYRNGKREVWNVGVDIAKALKNVDPSMNIVMKAISKFLSITSTGVRVGSTLIPNFFIKNAARDTIQATINSQSGFKIGIDSYVGFLNAVDGVRGITNKVYSDWLKSTGTQSTFQSWNRDYFKNEFGDFKNENVRWYNKITNSWEMLKLISEVTENAPRIGEFKKAYDKAIAEGLSERDALRRAGFEGRNLTIDFQRIGASIISLNRISAFFNASLQGTDKTIQQIKDPRTRASALIRTGYYITLPSMLIWWLNKDNEDYKSVSDVQKDLNWIIITGEGKDAVRYRLPKPQFIGQIFGTGIEKLLDAWYRSDPKAVNNYFKNLISTTITNLAPIPDFAKPYIQRKFNYNLFTEQPWIPAYLENMLPEYQYTEYTTESAKLIAKAIRTVTGDESKIGSPYQVDSAALDWTGGIGKSILWMTDQALIKSGLIKDPIKPDQSIADIPIIGAFVVRNPGFNSSYITRFNEEYKKIETRVRTVDALRKQGNDEAADFELSKIPANKLLMIDTHEALLQKQQAIKNIYNNKDFKSYEKRQMIDEIYRSAIKDAKNELTRLKINN